MTLTNESKQPIEIFYSYSHKDEKLRSRLEVHLSLLKQEGLVKTWHDRQIGAGKEWETEIATYLNTSQIILLLVSPDFLASEYCYSIEVKRALERHERREARVIPIILRSVDWQGAPFSKLQALPLDGKPITSSSWHNRDEAFLDVATGIRKVIEELNTANMARTDAIEGNEKVLEKGSHKNSFEQPTIVTPKFFYYISKSKVNMLLPSLSAKGTYGKNGELVKDTLMLIEELERQHLLFPMADSHQIEPSLYITDNALWRHGLFSFSTEYHPAVATYLLWRTYSDSIVLLVGSPNNILGDKVVEDGVFVPGTSGAYLEVLRFVSNHLKTDEPRAVTSGMVMTYGEDIEDIPEQSLGRIKSRVHGDSIVETYGEGIEDIPEQSVRRIRSRFYRDSMRAPEIFELWNKEPNAVSLGIFCLKYLKNLPITQIDTIFKVFHTFEITVDTPHYTPVNYLPHEVEERRINSIEEAKRLNLDKFTNVYLGSPIYTAII
jgi:hypothetical protein